MPLATYEHIPTFRSGAMQIGLATLAAGFAAPAIVAMEVSPDDALISLGQRLRPQEGGSGPPLRWP
jgi:hypothetical protein